MIDKLQLSLNFSILAIRLTLLYQILGSKHYVIYNKLTPIKMFLLLKDLGTFFAVLPTRRKEKQDQLKTSFKIAVGTGL